MNIVFMGTPSFALPALDALAASPDHVISAVYTRPDAHAGRGNKMQPTRVKMRAEELGLPVFTPYSLREDGVVEHLTSLAPDVIIVAAFGALLTREVLDIPRFGCLRALTRVPIIRSVQSRLRTRRPRSCSMSLQKSALPVCSRRFRRSRRVPTSGSSRIPSS